MKLDVNAKFIKTYESQDELLGDIELIKKGIAFDEFDNFLRSCVKYDSYKSFAHKLELEHKISEKALYDVLSKTCEHLRSVLLENIK